MDVTNVGGGDASEMLVYLKNQVEAAVLLEHARETWEDGLGAGVTRAADFRFRVQHRPEDGELRFEAAIYDTVFREFASHELVIPLQPEGDLAREATGFVRPTADGAAIHSGANSDTPALAVANQTDVLARVGQLGDWSRVEWTTGRFGWLHSSAYTDADAPDAPAALQAHHVLQPPLVLIEHDQLWSDSDTLRLTGVVRDDVEVVDYYIWVSGQSVDGEERNRQKVSYTRAGADQVQFEQAIPLYPGINRILVVARDDQRMTSSAVTYVYRRVAVDATVQLRDPG